MTAIVILIALALVGQSRAGVVNLSCSDNATCIENMAREVVRSLREQRTVRLFNTLTIEPVKTRQMRANQGWLSKFLQSHAFNFDWNDYSFTLTNPKDRSDAMELIVYESRTAKDVSDPNSKKSNSKDDGDVKGEDKAPKGLRRRRRHKKKVIQAIIPLLFGMKSAGVVIFALALVTVLTVKAFIASKLALLVSVGMALKKLYETYGSGVGLQNHPYLYSQYPIDFPSATSHAYSVSGVSPQFASPEMYNPTALANPHAHELLQNDATAQQSQSAPLLLNSTRAAERWDGKSKLLKFFEPVINSIRSFVDPIANVFYDAMPATFRGLNSDVSTTKSYENEPTAEETKKPKEILVPQPRFIAQRKMNNRKTLRHRPKKYSELKVDLDRLKHNKDLYDYIKTKKYKHNYPNTYYYPRIKYSVNPTMFVSPNNSRLIPYRREPLNPNTSTEGAIGNDGDDWKPIVVFDDKPKTMNATRRSTKKKIRKSLRKRNNRRSKRSIGFGHRDLSFRNASINFQTKKRYVNSNKVEARGFFDFLNIFSITSIDYVISKADDIAKSVFKNDKKASRPPLYYSVSYELLNVFVDMIEGIFEFKKTMDEPL